MLGSAAPSVDLLAEPVLCHVSSERQDTGRVSIAKEGDVNHIVLAGNLTADPELRYTQSGKAVANFTVAVSRNERRNGTWAEVTDGFFNVVAWGQLGEHIASSCKKSARVLVSGKLIQRSFEVEGTKRSSIEITASAVGPELKFATAEVSKASSANAAASEDTNTN
jgi:single-strand DNA-binding protein